MKKKKVLGEQDSDDFITTLKTCTFTMSPLLGLGLVIVCGRVFCFRCDKSKCKICPRLNFISRTIKKIKFILKFSRNVFTFLIKGVIIPTIVMKPLNFIRRVFR